MGGRVVKLVCVILDSFDALALVFFDVLGDPVVSGLEGQTAALATTGHAVSVALLGACGVLEMHSLEVVFVRVAAGEAAVLVASGLHAGVWVSAIDGRLDEERTSEGGVASM